MFRQLGHVAPTELNRHQTHHSEFMIILFLFVFAVVQYEVCVYTGDHWAAGTDASVFILLIGVDGSSERLPLLHSNNRSKFARNQVPLQCSVLLFFVSCCVFGAHVVILVI